MKQIKRLAKLDDWRQSYKRQNPDATDEEAQLYVDNKRKRKIKIAQDKVAFDRTLKNNLRKKIGLMT